MLQAVSSRSSILCSRCHAPLDPAQLPGGEWHACPYCHTPARLEVFPAYAAGVLPPSPSEHILAEGEASCFYHGDKRAVVPCDACGRYLCGLCRIEWGDQNFCPGCLEAGSSQRKMHQLETSRTLYDSIALALGTIPIVLFYITIVTAPITLFLVWRYWKTPLSIVPRTRIRFVLAAAFAILELALLATLVFALIYVVSHRNTMR